MSIRGIRQQPEMKRRFRSKIIYGAVAVAAPFVACGVARADFQPTLPTIGAAVYNAAQANVIGGNTTTAITTGSADNSSALNNLIARASAAGGGTIIIPAGTYKSNTLTLLNGINLDITPTATIQDATPTATLITTSGSSESNIAITGGGIINGNATSTSSNNLMSLQKITNLEINGVTIENSSHEHLVPEQDNNVTINAITIQDPKGYLGNADGLDYSGNNFLIENSSFADGDDNIVAKPGSTSSSTNNVLIQNDIIGNGHGISIGGQTNGGLTNMTVNNVTFNGTANGFRLKAGRANGGVVTGVSISNVTMTNVPNPIFISSWYNNGGDQYPTNGPANATTAAYTAGSTPLWNQVSFNNIQSLDTVDANANAGLIYGLPEAPVLGFTFNNVSLQDTAGTPTFLINYAGYTGTYNALAAVNSVDEILFENSSINGAVLTPSSLTNANQFTQPPGGLFNAVVVIAVPEPASMALMAGGIALVAGRRRSRLRKA
jgi:polygalacturonase